MSSGWAIEAANSIESKQRNEGTNCVVLSHTAFKWPFFMLPHSPPSSLSHDEDEWSLSQVCSSIFCEVLVGL
jgi:hypothetical protein